MNALPDSASPLYEKVKDYILHNIGSGAWEHDKRIPSENELVATLGISRMTVHRALRELTAAGLLLRIQGVGTFVAPQKAQSGLLEINNIAAEITARGHQHRAEVLLLETTGTTPELMSAFELSGRREVYHSLVLHLENDMPVQLEERFVNPDLAPDYDKQDFTLGTTYDYLVHSTPITELEHIISAIPADEDMAAHLQVQPGDPCLLLHRRTWTGAVVATVNHMTYAGTRYSLGSRYRPAIRA